MFQPTETLMALAAQRSLVIVDEGQNVKNGGTARLAAYTAMLAALRGGASRPSPHTPVLFVSAFQSAKFLFAVGGPRRDLFQTKQQVAAFGAHAKSAFKRVGVWGTRSVTPRVACPPRPKPPTFLHWRCNVLSRLLPLLPNPLFAR